MIEQLERCLCRSNFGRGTWTTQNLEAVLRRQDIQNRILQARLASRSGTKFLELIVKDGSAAAGARLADLRLPQSCIVVSIVRSERVLIPGGNTKLQLGDTVTLFAETELAGLLRERFGDVAED